MNQVTQTQNIGEVFFLPLSYPISDLILRNQHFRSVNDDQIPVLPALLFNNI